MNRSNQNKDRSEGLGGTYFKCVNANLDDETFNKMKKASSKYLSRVFIDITISSFSSRCLILDWYDCSPIQSVPVELNDLQFVHFPAQFQFEEPFELRLQNCLLSITANFEPFFWAIVTLWSCDWSSYKMAEAHF